MAATNNSKASGIIKLSKKEKKILNLIWMLLKSEGLRKLTFVNARLFYYTII